MQRTVVLLTCTPVRSVGFFPAGWWSLWGSELIPVLVNVHHRHLCCTSPRLQFSVTGASVDASSIFIDVNAPRPGTVRRCILREGDVHGTFSQTSRQRSPCVLLVFIVCLRGAYPCTINRVSHQQTWVCLLFCCWSPPDIHPCVVAHVAFILPLDSSLKQMFRCFPCVVLIGFVIST